MTMIQPTADVAITSMEHAHSEVACLDDRIMLVRRLRDISRVPAQVEMLRAFLCIHGTSTVHFERRTFLLGPNDLLVCPPDLMIEHGATSPDFRFRGVFMAPALLKRLYVLSSGVWNVRMLVEENPVLHLSDESAKVFCQYFDLLSSRLSGEPRRHQRQVVDALLYAFLYEFHDTLELFVPHKSRPYSAAENLFKSFVTELEAAYPKPRSVNYYAGRLCVTPKYLSSVCKKLTHRTALDIIGQYTMQDIMALLRDPTVSIKEVSNRMNFPSLSFFGKYVKKHLGCSPKHYREQMTEE